MTNETRPNSTPSPQSSESPRNPRGMQYVPSHPKEPKQSPMGAFLGTYFLVFLIVLGALYLRGEHLERERQAEEAVTEDTATDVQSDVRDVADIETETVGGEDESEMQSEAELELLELETEPDVAE